MDCHEIIETAFSIKWCKDNFVLFGSTFVRDKRRLVDVYVLDIKHVGVLGDFIKLRLQRYCSCEPEYHVLSKAQVLGGLAKASSKIISNAA